MKKILIICFTALILGACELNTDDGGANDYRLTEQDKVIFNNILESELQSNGWGYDPSLIRFGEGILPSEGDDNYQILKNVSEKTGYSVDLWQDGEKMATAYAVIFHPNGDLAGEARFYFKDNTIVCGYYTYNNRIYSIDDETVFLTDPGFDAYENVEFEGSDYTESSITLPFDDFLAVSPNSGIAVVIENDRLDFYTMRTGTFQLSKSYSQSELGCIPIDADFDNDGRCAVLGGRRNEEGRIDSGDIIILDSLLNMQNENFKLYEGSYEQLVFDNGIITLSGGTVISEFDCKTHQNINNVHLIHFAKSMYSWDIYGNGARLYTVSDGSNLFVYDSSYRLLWRTYNSTRTYSDCIYFADTNLDGIKEMYVENIITGTSDKYVLDETGFRRADSIRPDSRLLLGDFDCNGRCEIISDGPDGKKLYS